MMRKLNLTDRFIINVDQGLRTLLGKPQTTARANPAKAFEETELSEEEKRHVAGLMRVDHAGEIAAQALYQGQALTARLPEVREQMQHAAKEENDHLVWCEQRLLELDSHVSYLGGFWYAGSFLIGAIAGAAGDKWSLGFVAETERQVIRHLDSHLSQLPPEDEKSRAILQQMKIDEKHHATVALKAGGAPLPKPLKQAMQYTSKLMTQTAYYV